jgi:hypothetical protein
LGLGLWLCLGLGGGGAGLWERGVESVSACAEDCAVVGGAAEEGWIGEEGRGGTECAGVRVENSDVVACDGGIWRAMVGIGIGIGIGIGRIEDAWVAKSRVAVPGSGVEVAWGDGHGDSGF